MHCTRSRKTEVSNYSTKIQNSKRAQLSVISSGKGIQGQSPLTKLKHLLCPLSKKSPPVFSPVKLAETVLQPISSYPWHLVPIILKSFEQRVIWSSSRTKHCSHCMLGMNFHDMASTNYPYNGLLKLFLKQRDSTRINSSLGSCRITTYRKQIFLDSPLMK